MEYFAYETELYEAKNTENKFVFLNSGWKTLYPVRNVRNMLHQPPHLIFFMLLKHYPQFLLLLQPHPLLLM